MGSLPANERESGRRARVALALAFEAVQQLARREHGPSACSCRIEGSDPADCACQWVTRAGAPVAVIRGAWLKAGLTSTTY